MNRAGLIRIISSVIIAVTLLMSCGAGKKASVTEEQDSTPASEGTATLFSADSAYAYVARQVEFGPRVPGTDAHRLCGDWLSAKLRSFGAEVTEQTSTLTTFDGTRIPMRNIFARINPDAGKRMLLIAHWDSLPSL